MIAPEEHPETETATEPVKVHHMIQSGEYILVKANVHICPFFKEYYTGYARVTESGVTLFGHEIAAAGHSAWYVGNELAGAIAKETGRKPESLKIEVIGESEFLSRQQDIDADIDLFHLAVARCEAEIERSIEEPID